VESSEQRDVGGEDFRNTRTVGVIGDSRSSAVTSLDIDVDWLMLVSPNADKLWCNCMSSLLISSFLALSPPIEGDEELSDLTERKARAGTMPSECRILCFEIVNCLRRSCSCLSRAKRPSSVRYEFHSGRGVVVGAL